MRDGRSRGTEYPRIFENNRDTADRTKNSGHRHDASKGNTETHSGYSAASKPVSPSISPNPRAKARAWAHDAEGLVDVLHRPAPAREELVVDERVAGEGVRLAQDREQRLRLAAQPQSH